MTDEQNPTDALVAAAVDYINDDAGIKYLQLKTAVDAYRAYQASRWPEPPTDHYTIQRLDGALIGLWRDGKPKIRPEHERVLRVKYEPVDQ